MVIQSTNLIVLLNLLFQPPNEKHDLFSYACAFNTSVSTHLMILPCEVGNIPIYSKSVGKPEVQLGPSDSQGK